MSGDLFERLDADLAQLVHDGAHLSPAIRRGRRIRLLARRGAVVVALAFVLAASLVSEFPASAGGHPAAPVAAVVLGR
jgi:hypothetical protein